MHWIECESAQSLRLGLNPGTGTVTVQATCRRVRHDPTNGAYGLYVRLALLTGSFSLTYGRKPDPSLSNP